MTREEIIKYLNIIKAFFLGSEHQPISDAYFALDEAIKALEREPCEDCISRQAIIDEMGDTNMDIYTEEVKDFVRSLPSVNPQEWIPVSERLPEDNKEVLVYVNAEPYLAWLNDGEWKTEDFIIEKDFEPIAWMPLPEPYEAESE